MNERLMRLAKGKGGLGMAMAMDAHKFACRYGEIYKDLYRFALCMTRHAHDAEDAVGEAVLAAFKQRNQLRCDEAFKAWMFSILANTCRKKLKAPQRWELRADPTAGREPLAAADGSALAEGGVCELRDDVRAAFAAVSEEERLVVSLSVFGGYSSREIGDMLRLNANTVRSKRKRALEKMGAMLKDVAK